MEVILHKAAGHLNAASKMPDTHLEVEISQSIPKESRHIFVGYIKNWLQNGGEEAQNYSIVRRCDIQYPGTKTNIGKDIISDQCRIFFDGNKQVKREFMRKDTHFRGPIGNEIVTISYEIQLPEVNITHMELINLKSRMIFKTEYWLIDFMAFYTVQNKDPATVGKMRKLYFDAPIKTAKDFIDYVSNKVYFFHGYRIEFEIIDPTKILTDSEAIITEYERLNRVVYGIDVSAMRYQQLLRRMATAYYPNRTVQTIKQITPQAKTLDHEIFKQHYPFEGWFVSEKADGTRAILYMDTHMNVYMFAASLKVLHEKPQIDKPPTEIVVGAHEGLITIIDGEYIESIDTFLVFDVIIHHSVPYHISDFKDRLGQIQSVVDHLSAEFQTLKINVKLVPKQFHQLPKSTDPAYGAIIRGVLADAEKKPYKNDGLVYLSPDKSYLQTLTFKWKIAAHNTIDFLARSPPSGNPMSNLVKPGHYIYLLFCSVSTVEYLKNPNPMAVRSLFSDDVYAGNTVPALFKTSLMSNVHYFNSKDKDLDDKIVELTPRWTDESHSQIEWELSRIRDDRVNDRTTNTYFGNYGNHAERNLSMFMYPIDIEMLISGPNAYFISPRAEMYAGAAKFNNKIKAELAKQYMKVSSVCDIAGGRGSDIYNYSNVITQVFVLEIDAAAIVEMMARKQQILAEAPNYPRLMIIQHDMNQPAKIAMAKLRINSAPIADDRIAFNVVTCHFALHYFTRTEAEMKNTIELITGILAQNGYFIFTIFNDKRVNNLLDAHSGDWRITLPDGIIKYRIMRDKNGGIKLILPFTGGAMIDETLIPLDTFFAIAAKKGLKLAQQIPFEKFITNAEYAKAVKEMKHGDIDFCKLYDIVIMTVS